RRRLLFLPNLARAPPAALRLRPGRDAGVARPAGGAGEGRGEAGVRPRSRFLEGRAASARPAVLRGVAMRICFVGDSMTNGTGDHEHLGWVGRVLQDERKRWPELTGYN